MPRALFSAPLLFLSHVRARLLGLLLALILALAPLPLWAGQITVFAAASLKTALDEVAQAWHLNSGHRASLSFAGSSALARQIQAGAPADLFVSANTAWMDHLANQGLLEPGSRSDLLGNRLVLIGPAQSPPLTPDQIAQALGDGRLAMGLVRAVPAGLYGKAALQHLGLWDHLSAQVAQTDNVRAALALVAMGEAPLGITYLTDALADPRVSVRYEFPADSHPPITYPMAIPTDSDAPEALEFLQFLKGPVAKAIFLRHGFTEPPQPK